MQPIYLSKSLATASSTGLGSVSSAATPVITIKTSALDTARRIAFSSSASVSSGVTFTVTGTIEGGGTKTETVIASTGAAVTTLDYLTITSVSVSCASLPIVIGTVPLGGTTWHISAGNPPGPIGGTITFSSSSNSMTGMLEWTHDDPTGTWPIIKPGVAFPQPTVWVSSVFSGGVNTATHGTVNAEGSEYIPVYAYRLTITSSSSTAGTVFATVLEPGP
jgi:hypothetical protein